MIKKLLFLLFLIVIAYYCKGVYVAFELEHEAEKVCAEKFTKISRPWSAEVLRENASWWMLNKAKLTPEKFISLAEEDLGSFISYQNPPNCHLRTGVDSYSAVEHTYSICSFRARFQKSQANIKVRMVIEDNEWKVNDFLSIN